MNRVGTLYHQSLPFNSSNFVVLLCILVTRVFMHFSSIEIRSYHVLFYSCFLKVYIFLRFINIDETLNQLFYSLGFKLFIHKTIFLYSEIFP